MTADEQLRAAALALNRDLGVSAANLRLATQSVTGSLDDAWVAYTTNVTTANVNLSTRIFAALNSGITYWVGAPGGYIVGVHGASAVETTDTVVTTEGTGLPAVAAAMLGPAVGGMSAPNNCVFVDRERALLSAHTLALWQAASGVTMTDGSLPNGVDIQLVLAPSLQIVARTTLLDVALRYAMAASVACALIAGSRLAMSPYASASTVSAQTQPPAGALLDRVATISPDTLIRTQTATYASGAWVFSLNDAFDGATQLGIKRALEANGMQTQVTATPTPRLRVSLAP